VTDALTDLLDAVARGAISPGAAAGRVRTLVAPAVEDLGFARIDHDRARRQGFPEVVFGEGKTSDRIVAIAERIVARGHSLLVTRVTPSVWNDISPRLPDARYWPEARVVTCAAANPVPQGSGVIAVVAAGTSDLPVAEEAAVSAEAMGNTVERIYDVGVAGLHRLLAEHDRLRAARVVIVVAGMEGALPSVVGGLVAAPVVAVPTSVGYGASFGGLAALLAMLNSCASGVAVMNIDNGFGAAAHASRITHGG
jgi:NCAIR mutase (PurE)-related protein